MTSPSSSNVEEFNDTDNIPQFKIEKIILDGELLSSSLPQLDTAATPKSKTPRDRADTQEKTLKYSGRKTPVSPNKRELTPRTKSAVCKPTASSSIPLPITKTPKPTKVASHNIVKANISNISNASRISKPIANPSKTTSPSQNMNKHTLEIQFFNKKKKLTQLQKDLNEKQKPVLELYNTLLQIKKKLEQLGKNVCLEEIKLIPPPGAQQEVSPAGAGESIQPEAIIGVQSSIEDIPKSLMMICENLLERRNMIVDILDSVVKSEVNVGDLAEQIDTLKFEGTQLQNELDAVINKHQSKIKEILKSWQLLVNEKKGIVSNVNVEEIEDKLKAQEKLTMEANQTIQDLQKKLEERRISYEKSTKDLNAIIGGLRSQLQKAEADLEAEKKNVSDYKSRSNSTVQASKNLRKKVEELENDKKNADSLNADLTKKVKALQDQLKHKESQWNKEKEDMTKNMKHQENMLQKLSSDKSSFETRLQEVQGERSECEENLTSKLENLQEELERVKNELNQVNSEREEAVEKCKGMEELMVKMGLDCKATMDMVSNSIDWGKDFAIHTKAEEYSESMMKDILIQEYTDKIQKLEEENKIYKEAVQKAQHKSPMTETEKMVMNQHDVVSKYKQLLSESERKLTEKFLALRSQEVGKLTSEIRQLKVRQEHLEEINQKCPTENLQKMIEEGRSKLSELMKKTLESEYKISQCEHIIEKQSKQLNEMENLLRYKENIAGVLKTSRDELVIEKDSLTRYSQDIRNALTEVTKESKMKERLIIELQEKIDSRERQICKLGKEIQQMETNLIIANEKRYKLQETIGSMEKELQATKAHFKQLADLDTRYDPG